MLDLWTSRYRTVFNLIFFSQTVEHDTKGSSNATETGTKETSTSHDPEGEEESITVEEVKKGEARDGGKHIPASPVVSPRPGSTQENQIILTTVNTHLTLGKNLLGTHWWFIDRTCAAIWSFWHSAPIMLCTLVEHYLEIFLLGHGLSQPRCVNCQPLIFVSYDSFQFNLIL